MTDFSMSRRGAILAMMASAHAVAGAAGAVSAAASAAAASASASAAAAAAPGLSTLPGDSVYRLRSRLVDQGGRDMSLAALRGAPVIASMFYSSCDMVCPLIFETIKQTRLTLPALRRERVKVLMVSFDPERDTVAQLKRTAEAHGCDEHWTLARAGDADVRLIAAALGVQYRKLPSGAFNHSSALLLLDADGRIAARSGKLGEVDTPLASALSRLA